MKELVEVAEKHAHGNPSGIDMEAIFSKKPIWFQKGKKAETIDINKPFYLVVADTGRMGDTRTAVSRIKKKMDNHPSEQSSPFAG